MSSPKAVKIIQIAIMLILVTGAFLRFRLYGDPRLSIGSNDTPSYISSAQAPLFSWEMFTNRRLFTTNLLYKIFEPKNGYEIPTDGSADTSHRIIQAGFEQITVFQFIISLLSWGYLAYITSKHLNFSGLKILSTIVILLFAFTPQIADWDSVLMSESLTFSLFALQLALLIEIVFLLQNNSFEKSVPYMAGWMIVCFFWTFMRDTNLYAIPASVALLLGIWFSIKFKKNWLIGGAILGLAGIFVLGWSTSQMSSRDTIEINHVYQSDLLSFPTRVAILQNMGMPDPNSPEFPKWFEDKGVGTFLRFMVANPGYVATKFGKDVFSAFEENMQTYFRITTSESWREAAIQIGNAMHPKSATPLLISLLLLPILLYSGWTNPTENNRAWAWIGSWLFTVASLTIFTAIMAGATGLFRHTLFSTVLFRLSMWLFLIIAIDLEAGGKTLKQIDTTKISVEGN